MTESKGLEKLAKAQELYVMYHLNGINDFDDEILYHLNLEMGLGLKSDNKVMAHYIRGHIYLDQEHFSKAKAEFEIVLELDKKSEKKLGHHLLSRTWEHLSELHKEQGNREQTIKCLEEGIKQLELEYDLKEMGARDSLVRLYCLLGLKYEMFNNDTQALLIY